MISHECSPERKGLRGWGECGETTFCPQGSPGAPIPPPRGLNPEDEIGKLALPGRG